MPILSGAGLLVLVPQPLTLAVIFRFGMLAILPTLSLQEGSVTSQKLDVILPLVPVVNCKYLMFPIPHPQYWWEELIQRQEALSLIYPFPENMLTWEYLVALVFVHQPLIPVVSFRFGTSQTLPSLFI